MAGDVRCGAGGLWAVPSGKVWVEYPSSESSKLKGFTGMGLRLASGAPSSLPPAAALRVRRLVLRVDLVEPAAAAATGRAPAAAWSARPMLPP